MQDYAKLFPYISAFIIFLGVYRLMLYYFCFGINIMHFLEFTEILTSFFDYIILLVALLILCTILMLITGKGIYRNSSLIVNQSIHEDHKKSKSRLNKLLKYNKVVLIVVPILLCLLFIFAAMFMPDKAVEHILEIIVLICFLLLVLLMYEMKEKIKQLSLPTQYKSIIWTIMFGLICLTIISLYSLDKVDRVRSREAYLNVQFELDRDSTVTSNETQYYIGNTKNYLFFHDALKGQTQAIPMNRVTNIIFPNTRINKMGLLF